MVFLHRMNEFKTHNLEFTKEHSVLLGFPSHLKFDCVIIKHILCTFMCFAAVYWLNQKQSSMKWKINWDNCQKIMEIIFLYQNS